MLIAKCRDCGSIELEKISFPVKCIECKDCKELMVLNSVILEPVATSYEILSNEVLIDDEGLERYKNTKALNFFCNECGKLIKKNEIYEVNLYDYDIQEIFCEDCI